MLHPAGEGIPAAGAAAESGETFPAKDPSIICFIVFILQPGMLCSTPLYSPDPPISSLSTSHAYLFSQG